MKRYINFSGYCPEFMEESDIEITYTEVSTIGHYVDGTKKIAYCCEYEAENGCKTSQENNDCPIYKSAPNSV